VPYVELHAHSAYSFLDGASQPEELAARAAELGYTALALTDHDGIYGSLEFAHAAKHFGVRPITGAELTLDTQGPPGSAEHFPGKGGGSHVTLLVESSQGYANLCRLITYAHARTRPKEGRDPLPPSLELHRLEQLNEGLVCLSGCARRRARRPRCRCCRTHRTRFRPLSVSSSRCSAHTNAATCAATQRCATSPSR